MSPEAKHLIVHLLNRNKSRRLGAGPEGANEIKKHAFFNGVDWKEVERRKQPVTRPRATI
jgi:serine/threonine protein kinase